MVPVRSLDFGLLVSGGCWIGDRDGVLRRGLFSNAVP